MARTKHIPVTLTPEQVTIHVYPFDGAQSLNCRIVADTLTCLVGPPARTCRIELGPQTAADMDGVHLRYAAKIVVRMGYRNAWILHSDGSKTPLLVDKRGA